MLTLDQLSFAFGKKVIFENINLSFEAGKVYGVVGANGVGKTTLFRLLSGLYKRQQGKVLLEGQALRPVDVSFLQTDPFFYPHMNGMEYLKIVLTDREKLEVAIKMCERLQIPLDQLVSSYSTGMKKKLAFSAALKQDRTVSIFDEPFNGVDLESNEILGDLLKVKPEDKIVLISSHILTMMNEICDEIIYIQKGFVIEHYSTGQFDELRDKIKAGIADY